MDTKSSNGEHKSPDYSSLGAGGKKRTAPRQRRTKQYFDSADWCLNGVPPSFEPIVLPGGEGHSSQKVFPTNCCPIEVIVHQEKYKKHFDSADWVLTGHEPLPFQVYRHQSRPNGAEIILQKKKSKKYFDSADWALEGYQHPINTQFPTKP